MQDTVIYAHRGLNHAAPENTLAAFAAASRSGVTWIETDTDILADGTAVIMHDSRTDRTTNRSGSIYDLTTSDLDTIDAGSWFSEDFVGERVPTLRELVSFLGPHDLNLNLELKGNTQGRDRSIRLVETVLEELRRLRPGTRVLISSFSPLLLAEVHRRTDAYELAWLVDKGGIGEDWRSVMELCGATALHPSTAVVSDRRVVDEIRRAGFGVNVWTVNSVQEANKLANWGCTGIITDIADQMVEAGRRG
jgi:glycerophosphoryl diester phosphodiesterase